MNDVPETEKKSSRRLILILGCCGAFLCICLILFLLIQGPQTRYSVPKPDFADQAQTALLAVRVMKVCTDQQKHPVEFPQFQLTGADLALLLKYAMAAAEDDSFYAGWKKNCFHLQVCRKFFPWHINLDLRFTGTYEKGKLRIIPVSAKAGVVPLPAFLFGDLCGQFIMDQLMKHPKARAVIPIINSITPVSDGFCMKLNAKELTNLPFLLMNGGNVSL